MSRLLPRALSSVVPAVVAVLLVAALPAAPAAAFTSVSGVRLNAVEARLVALINAARAARGMTRLTVVPGATDVARRWSAYQAGRSTISHNPNLARDVTAAGSSGWTRIAENVGTASGAEPDRLFRAYLDSPGHRANILNPAFRQLGIGWAERSNGIGYNTQVFVDRYATTYGRSRQPAYGGWLDRRVYAASGAFASFETGWDPRLVTAATAAGLWAGRLTVDAPAAGDQAARFAVRETAAGTGGAAELRLRDAVDFTSARALTVRLRATTGTGRALVVDIWARREWGTAVRVGSVTVPHGRTVAATLPLPTGARTFRNLVAVSVSRGALVALGASAGRSATVAVHSIAVVV